MEIEDHTLCDCIQCNSDDIIMEIEQDAWNDTLADFARLQACRGGVGGNPASGAAHQDRYLASDNRVEIQECLPINLFSRQLFAPIEKFR